MTDGDSVDGKGRLIDLCTTKEQATKIMHDCAEAYTRDLCLDEHDLEMYNDSAKAGDTNECGCEYVLQKVYLDVYKCEL